MKKKVLFVVFLFISLNINLISQNDALNNIWSTEDYKKAIIPSDGKFIIFEFDEFISFSTGEISFLCKWDTELNNNDFSFTLYSFNKENKIQKHQLGYSIDENKTNIVMRGIPGNRLWNEVISIYDFNGDGRDDILALCFWGMGYYIKILGVDPVTKEVVEYLNEEFFVNWPPTFQPVEFIRYKGMSGLKLLQVGVPPVRSGINFPVPGLRGMAWIFYTWDESQRQFIEIEEVDPQFIQETYINTGEWRYRPSILISPVVEIIEEEIIIETQEKTNIYNKDSFPLLIMFLIGSGVVVITGLIVVLIKRNMNHKISSIIPRTRTARNDEEF